MCDIYISSFFRSNHFRSSAPTTNRHLGRRNLLVMPYARKQTNTRRDPFKYLFCRMWKHVSFSFSYYFPNLDTTVGTHVA